MGILRTDKISGLETPTAVTGSVYFDGTGDYLATEVSNDFALGTNDFTFEMWVYYDNKNNGDTPAVLDSTTTTYAPLIGYIENAAATNGHAVVYISANGSSWGIASAKTFGFINEKQWYHLAISRSGSNFYLFKDGQLTDSFTSSSAIHQGANQIGFGRIQSSVYFDGYISNARLIKGTALYTSNFTPSVHELEVIDDTVLLCCNNPDSAGADGTGKTITVNGDAAASTFSPGLTRDFTSGTEFQGVTVFDTQGYFVPPSGTTEQRGRGRGIFWGGNNGSFQNIIQFVQISTQGNASDFGDLTAATSTGGSCASATRGLYGGGQNPGTTDTIEFITIATTGNATDFGNLQVQRDFLKSLSNSTRGIFAGGRYPTPSTYRDEIDFLTIATLGNASDFGDLLAARQGMSQGVSSPTRGLFAGGSTSPGTHDDVIQYITIATTGDALDFGDLTQTTFSIIGGASSSTRGLFAGGSEPSPAVTNVISYVTIATLGNAQDFGDLTDARRGLAGVSNSSRGAFGGGLGSPTDVNTIDYVTIATTGNANDFGDLTHTNTRNIEGCSDSHGGIS